MRVKQAVPWGRGRLARVRDSTGEKIPLRSKFSAGESPALPGLDAAVRVTVKITDVPQLQGA